MGRLRNLRLGVANVVRWLPLIWRDRDWDHQYLLDLIAAKCRFMAEHHEQEQLVHRWEQTAAELRRVAWLLENAEEAAWCDHRYFGKPGFLHYDGDHTKRYIDEATRIMRRKMLTWWS